MKLSGPPGSVRFELNSEPALNDSQIVTLLTVHSDPSSPDNDAVQGALFNAGLQMVFNLSLIHIFTVPKDQPYGKMMLEVRGGGVIPLPYLLEQQKYNLSDEVLDRLRTYKNFDDLQKNIMDEDQNNQVVIEILNPNVSMISKEDDGRESAEIQGKKVQDTPDYLHKEDNKLSLIHI